jgi:hypothetical protein
MAMAKCNLQHTKNQPRTIATFKVFNVKVCAKIIAHIVATLALGSRPRQRGCKVVARGSPGAKARGSPGVKARGSPRVTSHTPGNVRKCEGVNPHTPKAIPTLGDGVPVDSRNFRERLQGSKLNGLWHYLYH